MIFFRNNFQNNQRLFRVLVHHLETIICTLENENDFEDNNMDLGNNDENMTPKEDRENSCLLRVKEWLDNNILSNANIRFHNIQFYKVKPQYLIFEGS